MRASFSLPSIRRVRFISALLCLPPSRLSSCRAIVVGRHTPTPVERAKWSARRQLTYIHIYDYRKYKKKLAQVCLFCCCSSCLSSVASLSIFALVEGPRLFFSRSRFLFYVLSSLLFPRCLGFRLLLFSGSFCCPYWCSWLSLSLSLFLSVLSSCSAALCAPHS